MNVVMRGLPATGAGLLLTTTAAFADVTAQQVWQDWQDGVSGLGNVTMSAGSEAYADGVLTVTDFTVSSVNDEGEFSVAVAELVFAEQGDGSVVVTSTPEQTVEINGDDFHARLTVTQTEAVTTVSGAPGATHYAFVIPQSVARLDEFLLEGEAMTASLDLIISGVSGDFGWEQTDEMLDMEYDFSIDRMDLKASLVSPEDPDDFATLNGFMTELHSAAALAIPANIDPDNPEEMFEAGFMIESNGSAGPASLVFHLTEMGQTTDASFSMDGSRNHVSLDGEALAYDVSLSGLSGNASSPAMPFPVALSAGEIGLGLLLPMSSRDEPAPFSGRITLADVEVSEELWSIVDAGGVIPRDPATLNLDISGTATLTRNLYEDDVIEGMEPPGMFNTIDINTVDLAFGGATAHADGAFTFDPDSAAALDGMPMPEGRIDIAVSGVNGLMQKLGEIGLLPPEQAMGVTMMLGMFGVPSGDDALTSTIEIDAAGQVTANGMPLPF